MKNSKILKTVLILAGMIAAAIGASMLLSPVAFHAKNSVTVGGSISSLSEARATGGGLLVMGVLIAAGAFVTRLTFTSAVLSALLFLSYGTSRLVSMAIDGIPTAGLIQATVIELVVGTFSVFVLARYRERMHKGKPQPTSSKRAAVLAASQG